MSDLVERMLDEIDRLAGVLLLRDKIIRMQKVKIIQLEAVVDAARHLLAGGDKEAVYHLEKALEALENKDE